MNDRPPRYLFGAVVGGLVMGVLTAVPLLGCCCFLWGAGGGALGAYLAAREAHPFGGNQGLLAGLAASGIGTVVHAVLAALVSLLFAGGTAADPDMTWAEDMPPEVQEFLRSMQESGSITGVLISALIVGVIFAATAATGGVLVGLLVGRKQAAASSASQEDEG